MLTSQLPLEVSTVRDATGRVILDVGLLATYFITSGHSQEKRQAVKQCLLEFAALADGQLRQIIPQQFKRANDPELKATVEHVAEWLTAADFDEEDSWEFCIHAGETPGAASTLRIDGFGRQNWRSVPPHNSLSFLSVVFPLNFFASRQDSFVALFERWARILQPTHGYGGVGFSTSPDPHLDAQYASDLSALAFRFPGVEVDYPVNHSNWCIQGIKGGNWLTVLSSRWSNQLGTVDQIRGQLGDPFTVKEIDDGIIIQTGSLPEVGDSNRQITTPSLIKLAKLLRPVRIRMHPGIHGGGGFDREKFEAWINRFY